MKQFFFSLALIGTMVSCKSSAEKETFIADEPEDIVHLTDIQMKNGGVQTGAVMYTEMPKILKVNGRIDVPPQSMVSVSVPLGGYLKSTKLLPGSHVRKGEVIATVEDNQYIQLQQDYLTAKVQLEAYESEYVRQRDLNVSKASSDKIMEQAKSAYNSQRILIKALEEKLKLIGIQPSRLTENTISRSVPVLSPITGFVSKVYVNVGKYVTPAEVLFELVNPEDIHLNLRVFEKDLDQLNIGQKVISYTNANPEKRYAGDIILISKDISEDGVTEVHCHFDKFDKSLFPGMYMNGEIVLASARQSVLPEEAVVRFEGKEYVFVEIGDNRFQLTEVETGDTENGYTEIRQAQHLLDKKIAIKGAYALLMVIKNIDEED